MLENRVSILEVTPAQRRWFIGLTITLTVAGLACWAYYWLYYVCITHPNALNLNTHCYGRFYTYQAFVLMIGHVAQVSVVLSALLLILWSLVRRVLKRVSRRGKR